MLRDKDKKLLAIGVGIVLFLTAVGILLLLMERSLLEPATSFELVVFIMASTALLLAIVQGIAIERQIRAVRYGSSRITEAVHVLEKLTKEEAAIGRMLKKDIELDKLLVDFLSHHGVKSVNKNALADLRTKLK